MWHINVSYSGKGKQVTLSHVTEHPTREITKHGLPSLPLPDLQESNVRLRLTVVSTAGYGDQINKENR